MQHNSINILMPNAGNLGGNAHFVPLEIWDKQRALEEMRSLSVADGN